MALGDGDIRVYAPALRVLLMETGPAVGQGGAPSRGATTSGRPSAGAGEDGLLSTTRAGIEAGSAGAVAMASGGSMSGSEVSDPVRCLRFGHFGRESRCLVALS